MKVYNADTVGVRQTHSWQPPEDSVALIWHEPDHPGERSRTLSEIMQQYVMASGWQHLIRTGSTVVDIGAHSGDTTVVMQYLAGADGHVIAVEPNPMFQTILQNTVQANSGSWARATVDTRAVSAVSGQEVIIHDHGNAMCNGGIIEHTYPESVQQHLKAMSQNQFATHTVTLPDLIADHVSEPESVSFVKIDTEGHDLIIARGAEAWLTTHQPVLQLEWFWLWTPEQVQELWSWADHMQYRIYTPQGQPAQISQPTSDVVLIPVQRLDQYSDFCRDIT